jgi:hypothetical protein
MSSGATIFDGSKYFSSINKSLTVLIVNHHEEMVFEVIVIDDETNYELTRLYLDSDKLVSKINFQHFNMTFLIKLQAARRNQFSFSAEDVGSQIISSMTVTMILDRLEVRHIRNKQEAYLKPTTHNNELCCQLNYRHPCLPHGVEPFRVPMKSLNVLVSKIKPDDVKQAVSTPSTVRSTSSSDTTTTSDHASSETHSMLSLQHPAEEKRKGSFFDRFSFTKSNRNQIAPSEYSSKNSETTHPNADSSDVNTTGQKVRIKPGATNSLRNVFIV